MILKRKWIIFVFIITLLINIPISSVEATSSSEGSLVMLTKSTNLEQAKDFRVVLAVDRAPTLSGFGPIIVSYDDELFTYQHSEQLTGTGSFEAPQSGNLITITSYGGEIPISGQTYLVGVYFKTNNVSGTGSIKIESAEAFADMDLNEVSMTFGSSVSITVSAPVVKSDNNQLKSISVSYGSLSPDFSSDRLNYEVRVPSDLEQLTVTAQKEDGTASVSGGGTVNLNNGATKIQIVVTAENGDKRTYTVTAIKPTVSPTPTPSPTPEATPTPSPTPEPTATPTPSPTPVPPVAIDLPDGSRYVVMDLPLGFVVPEGFYRTMVTIGDQAVVGFESKHGELIMLYLTDERGYTGYHIFDEANQLIYPYLSMTVPVSSYVWLQKPADVAVPEGFTETNLIYNNEDLPAWQQDGILYPDTDRDVYLVYLMDSLGNVGFYVYNDAYNRINPYPLTDLAAPETGGQTDPTEPPATTPEEPVDRLPWMLIAIVLAVICLILIGLLIWLIIRARRQGPHDDDPYDGDDDEYDGFDNGPDDQGPSDPLIDQLPKIPPVKRVN